MRNWWVDVAFMWIVFLVGAMAFHASLNTFEKPVEEAPDMYCRGVATVYLCFFFVAVGSIIKAVADQLQEQNDE